MRKGEFIMFNFIKKIFGIKNNKYNVLGGRTNKTIYMKNINKLSKKRNIKKSKFLNEVSNDEKIIIFNKKEMCNRKKIRTNCTEPKLENEETTSNFNKNHNKEDSKETKVYASDLKICPNCNQELNGEKSKKNKNIYYEVCSYCGFVSKIIGENVFATDGNYSEMVEAYNLFKQKDLIPRQYSLNGNEKFNTKDIES